MEPGLGWSPPMDTRGSRVGCHGLKPAVRSTKVQHKTGVIGRACKYLREGGLSTVLIKVSRVVVPGPCSLKVGAITPCVNGKEDEKCRCPS